MGFYEKELNGFSELYCYVLKHSTEIYTFIYGNDTITATFDCMYESDNGLEDNEDGYDEYHAISFLNSETKELFEINYSNLPTSIMCGDNKIIQIVFKAEKRRIISTRGYQ